MGKGLGAFLEEAGAQPLGHAAHAFLGALHEDGHFGELGTDELAQVHAGVQFFRGGLVSAVQNEADIRDDAQQIALVAVVQGYGILVVGGHQDFRTGSLSEDHLLLVEGVPDGSYVLLQYHLVQQREVGGIVTHGILHQQDALHAGFQDVGRGVHAVFQQFDDGDDQVRAAVPVEDIVHAGGVPVFQLPVNLLGKRSEENHRHAGVRLLHSGGEVEHVHFAHVIQGDDQVPVLTGRRLLQRFQRRGHPFEDGRSAQVEVGVFLGDTHVQAAVFLEGEIVVVVAYQQYPADASGHERGGRGHTSPWSDMAPATLMNPARLAPLT